MTLVGAGLATIPLSALHVLLLVVLGEPSSTEAGLSSSPVLSNSYQKLCPRMNINLSIQNLNSYFFCYEKHKRYFMTSNCKSYFFNNCISMKQCKQWKFKRLLSDSKAEFSNVISINMVPDSLLEDFFASSMACWFCAWRVFVLVDRTGFGDITTSCAELLDSQASPLSEGLDSTLPWLLVLL